MPFEITPEPTPGERDALLLVLAAQNGAHEHSSRWWQTGIREAVEPDSEENTAPGQASARPRRSAGASRA